MARSYSVHLPAVCALVSFAYISQSLERHSLTGRPRLSSVLILLIAGSLCLVTSLFSKWLPGAQGRFDGQQRGGRYSALPGAAAGAKAAPVQMPPRPRRLSLPMLVVCIVVRLEIFHRVNYQQQCSAPGIESFLCLLLWAYETLTNPRKWALAASHDQDDPWGSMYTDIRDWLSGPRQTFFISGFSVFLFCFGTYLGVSQVTRSTYFCFIPLDSRAWTTGLQITGLLLDALIIILFWRMLAWSRTTKLKLRALGSTLLLSSISMALVWLGNRLTRGARPLELAFGSLYVFDIVVDSTIFATLAMSGALWVCDQAISVPSTILTCLIGLWTTVNNSLHLGTWEQLSKSGVLAPSALIVFGWSWFAYSHEVKTFLFLKRIQVVFLLGILMQWLLVYALFKSAPAFQRHPLSDLIYKANIEQDRWLRHATTSHELPVAIKVYQDRHDGRNPPPFFHEWYKLAKETKVVDEFRQIDRDLAPFRKVPAKYLRQRVTIMAEVPGVESIVIQEGGQVSHSDAGDDVKNQELEELVKIISSFAAYLPEMVIPVNLSPMPRILPSWNEAQSTSRADLSSMVDFIQSRTSTKEDEITDKSQSGNKLVQRNSGKSWSFTSARDLQDMHLAACPPTSKSRTSPHWRISDFCTVCARRHSKGPIMTTWEKSLEVCYQPDIYHLHGFFMTNPAISPLEELLPLFSASKMDGFSDIVFPLPSTIAANPDIDKALKDRKNSLFWRGRPGEHALSSQALRGSHTLRLMHLVTNPDPSEQVTMVLPFPDQADIPKEESKKDKRRLKDEFGYEEVSAAEASRALPFDMRLQQEGPCLGPMCALVQSTYLQDDSPSVAAFEHRYVLLMDEDNGPPRDLMGALRSGSVPFISTTFRTWYTERLLPWLHFVPIDTRFQALHTTLSYFTGTEGRPPLNGRETNMKEQSKDAQWIASQGRKWADAALGQKDLEVYMFRLLLEWGRLIDDERDKVGFWQDAKGELQSAGWTPRQKDSAAS